jgi:hypothetical protein
MSISIGPTSSAAPAPAARGFSHWVAPKGPAPKATTLYGCGKPLNRVGSSTGSGGAKK